MNTKGMNVKDMSIEELELLSYTDIAYSLLKDTKGGLNVKDLYQEICSLLGIDFEANSDGIVDFFTVLSTDKNFILLDNGKFDLRDKHSFKVVIEDIDDIEQEDIEDDSLSDALEEEEYIETDTIDTDDTVLEEDFDDEDEMGLTVVDEDELEE